MILGAISSAFSSACSFVSSAISSISSFAMTYGPKIGEMLSTVASVFQTVLQVLGVIKPEEKIEEIGDKAIQADAAGIKPENYDKYDDYVNAIRNFELDPEKSKNVSTEAKILAGIGIGGKALEDKFDLPVDSSGVLALMIASNAVYFNSDRVAMWLQSGDMPTILQYFDSKIQLTPKERADVFTDIIKIEKQHGSDQSERDIYNQISNVKDNMS